MCTSHGRPSSNESAATPTPGTPPKPSRRDLIQRGLRLRLLTTHGVVRESLLLRRVHVHVWTRRGPQPSRERRGAAALAGGRGPRVEIRTGRLCTSMPLPVRRPGKGASASLPRRSPPPTSALSAQARSWREQRAQVVQSGPCPPSRSPDATRRRPQQALQIADGWSPAARSWALPLVQRPLPPPLPSRPAFWRCGLHGTAAQHSTTPRDSPRSHPQRERGPPGSMAAQACQ
mmetsp:Transcript_35277/g.111188  ORF Transcript_35277/g.111188 Transcript_35277/m.111188 type:complete len:232 (-) Transcript_35277:48-743(-)